jgi:nicotinamidase/pyrazinamidase
VAIISKATDPSHDAYSTFDGTDLDARLHSLSVQRLYLCGLATEYCVLSTAMDALAKGYAVSLLRDAISAIGARPSDGPQAIDAMTRRGAEITWWQKLA